MAQFDDRLFKIVFSYTKNGQPTQLTLDGGLDIKAHGMQYVNAIQDECSLVISNLKRETRDTLATQLTQWTYDQERKSVQVYAGRVSTGVSLLYTGDIIRCVASQPPNIDLHIKSKTAQFWKYSLLKQAMAIDSNLSQIAQQSADSMGLTLQFEATDATIMNYCYTGSAIKQIDKLNAIGGIDAFVDGNTLVVKNKNVARSGTVPIISAQTGMIGIPEMTEYGVRIRTLLSNACKIGGKFQLISTSNPLLNDNYLIYQMGFEIASRDTPFYTILEAARSIHGYMGPSSLGLPNA